MVAAETQDPIPRPRLSLKPLSASPPDTASRPPMRSGPAEPVKAPPGNPQSFPPPPAKPVLTARPKATLKPLKEEGAAVATPSAPGFSEPVKLPAVLSAPPPPMPVSSVPPQEVWPATLNAPPPPGLAPIGAEAEPAEIIAIRKASTFPFPSPTANFPTPLPVNDPEENAAVANQDGLSKPKLFLAAVVLLGLGAAVFFTYTRFKARMAAKHTAPPPAVASAPANPVAAGPVPPVASKAKEELPAPANTVVNADQNATPSAEVPAVKSAQEETTAEPAPTPADAQEPAAPPAAAVKPLPSPAFKAWVINLKIQGMRGGDVPRVFIEHTSYVPGDTVNLQLGIIFTGYDVSTHVLTFQDKTGATFERRY